MMDQVALITGGAAGMGFAVAKDLVSRGWKVAILDVNESQGEQAVEALGEHASFFKTDVTRYEDQEYSFHAVFEKYGRLDFVFANAGIAGKANFYDHDSHGPPSLVVLDVCLKGVVYTSHLALQFLRRNPAPGGIIVSTASASIYASPELPLYTAAKHGVLGLMRSMSEELRNEGIRVNSILPGAIRTTLHSNEIWQQFDEKHFTPVEEVVSAVMNLVNDEKATGKAIEISAGEVFDRKQPEYCNLTMQKIMQMNSY